MGRNCITSQSRRHDIAFAFGQSQKLREVAIIDGRLPCEGARLGQIGRQKHPLSTLDSVDASGKPARYGGLVPAGDKNRILHVLRVGHCPDLRRDVGARLGRASDQRVNLGHAAATRALVDPAHGLGAQHLPASATLPLEAPARRRIILVVHGRVVGVRPDWGDYHSYGGGVFPSAARHR